MSTKHHPIPHNPLEMSSDSFSPGCRPLTMAEVPLYTDRHAKHPRIQVRCFGRVSRKPTTTGAKWSGWHAGRIFKDLTYQTDLPLPV